MRTRLDKFLNGNAEQNCSLFFVLIYWWKLAEMSGTLYRTPTQMLELFKSKTFSSTHILEVHHSLVRDKEKQQMRSSKGFDLSIM